VSVPAAERGGQGQAQARHVAIIMDGNGRWAKKRHVPRALGHQKGVEAVRALVRGAQGLGLDVLTLYAFSTENWRRPEDEVSDLMGLMKRFILSDLEEMAGNDIRLKIIGDYKVFKPDLVELIEGALARTAANTGTTIAVALNYGSMDEIARAATRAAAEGPITPETIAAHLDTADLPPLDLLIRTSGEERLSNFLLWQAAYAELWFTEVLWPDFTADHLKQAMDAFANRERRYGGR
jgi:undecaprenyl diphosphate synthase